MTISPFMLYVASRCTDIKLFFGAGAGLLFGALLGAVLMYPLLEQYFDDTEANVRNFKRTLTTALKWLVVPMVLMFLVYCLVPTTREMVAILCIPSVTDKDGSGDIPPAVMKAMGEFLETDENKESKEKKAK